MRFVSVLLSTVLFVSAGSLFAQKTADSSSLVAETAGLDGAVTRSLPSSKPAATLIRPLSRVAIGAGVSPLGVNLQIATNLNKYMNLRGTGNVFQTTISGISTNGFNVDAKLNLASAGASMDFYPFPRHGLRFSPGVLLYNTNSAAATFTVQSGTSFSLNDYTYYASSTNPVTGNGTFGLHTQKPAFTATTGWGDMIPRKGGHFSFPFEVGVAFIGAPAINVALTAGQVCDSQGQNCVNVATDPDVQNNLNAQVAKYKSDLDPLKTYPIVSFGVAYSFKVRKDSSVH